MFSIASIFIMKNQAKRMENPTSRDRIPSDVIDTSGTDGLKQKPSTLSTNKPTDVPKCDYDSNKRKHSNAKCGIPRPPQIHRKRAKLRTDKMKCNSNVRKGTKDRTHACITITPDKKSDKMRDE